MVVLYTLQCKLINCTREYVTEAGREKCECMHTRACAPPQLQPARQQEPNHLHQSTMSMATRGQGDRYSTDGNPIEAGGEEKMLLH